LTDDSRESALLPGAGGELTEKLTELQHQLGEHVRATMHIHLDADRCLEVIVLRGRSEPLRAYEPLPAARFEGQATTQYSEAFARLEAGDPAAMPAFAALVGLHADDALAGYHLRRLLNGAKGVRIQLEP